jgi:hypothetical protein
VVVGNTARVSGIKECVVSWAMLMITGYVNALSVQSRVLLVCLIPAEPLSTIAPVERLCRLEIRGQSAAALALVRS